METHLQFMNTWKGVFAAEFTLEQVHQRCSSLCNLLQERNASCLVAYDTRFMSDLFAHHIYRYLEQQGVGVHIASMPVPLPSLYHALQREQANYALVVSARNKPYWYNGLVLLKPDFTDRLHLPEDHTTQADMQSIAADFPYPSGITVQETSLISTSSLDLRKPYLDMLRSHVDMNIIRRVTMTIFADPMHGTTAGYLPAIIGDETQTMAIEINRETDPLFSKCIPLPCGAPLTRLRKLVRESDSHIGFAFSADGTALGVVEKNGEQLNHLEITLMLASYLSVQYRQKGLVVAPLSAAHESVTANGLEDWQHSTGLKLELSAKPDERLAEIFTQAHSNLLVGCTDDGEIVLGQYSLYPDALLAGLFMIELVARNGGRLRALLDELRAKLYSQ